MNAKILRVSKEHRGLHCLGMLQEMGRGTESCEISTTVHQHLTHFVYFCISLHICTDEKTNSITKQAVLRCYLLVYLKKRAAIHHVDGDRACGQPEVRGYYQH